MDKNKQVVIDMGSSHISVMATEILPSGEVHILSEESKKSNDIKYGVVEQHAEAAHTISRLTRLLQNSARLSSIDKLCVSLNAKTMKEIPVRIHRAENYGRAVTEDLLASMLQECENKFKQVDADIFEIIPLYYEIDSERIYDPLNQKANQITGYYNVIVGSLYIKEEIYRCFERTTALSPESYFPLGMEALSTVLLDDEDREKGCALINFGAMTTTLAIYAEGAMQQLMVVGLGGLNITRDIQELGISEVNAEKLKCFKGSALNNKITQPVRIQIASAIEEGEVVRIDTDFLATIIEARLSEMLAPIFSAIQELSFELEAGVVITGGGSKMNNLPEFIEEKMGWEVRYGDHSDWLCDNTNERFFDPAYSQIIGTAVLLHEYKLKNPNEKRDKKEKKPKNQTVKFTEKITNKILSLFEDDNYLK